MDSLWKIVKVGFQRISYVSNRFGGAKLINPIYQSAVSFSTHQRPPRPCSSFALFLQDRKGNYPHDMKVIGGSYMKVVAQEWKQLPLDEKQKYIDESRSAMVQYKHDLQALTDFERDEIKKERKQKKIARAKRKDKKVKLSMGIPKRPASAYNLFVRMLFLNKDINFSGRMSTGLWNDIYIKWNALSDSKKLELIEEAQKDKERYVAEMQQYVRRLRSVDMEHLVPAKYRKKWLEPDQPVTWDAMLKDWPKK